MANPLVAALNTVGQIETHVQRVADLEKQFNRMPLWRPATILSRQAAEARRMIAGMQDRMDGRLVVTLIGPSGAGKSTIFNALAGADDLSPVGRQRPTTRNLVVLSNDAHAARQLLNPIGKESVAILSGPASRHLEHLILVDTPDTDSTQSPGHIDLLIRVVERSDVLVCVFDAQNPQRRDHADFMAGLVRRFNGASLVAVVNKCDRQSDAELSESIGPEFRAYLKKTWDTQPETLLLVSARRHLKDPRWDDHAKPRHDLDQFNQLQSLVMDGLNRPGAGRDRRVANAGRISDYLLEQTSRAAAASKPQLTAARQQLAGAEHEAFQAALVLLQADDRRQILGVNVRLYQCLAQRWLGPVGWLVAIWSRLIVFGGGLTALLRFGNPLRQLWGAVSSWKRFKQSRSALDMLNDRVRVDAAMDQFRKSFLTRWPDIAGLLVDGGFDTTVRSLEQIAPEQDDVGQALDQLWSDALDTQIHRYGGGLSHFLLQLLLNLPAIALMGYVGWLTAWGFFSGHYLSSDFFLHAVLTIAIVLLLSFFLLQGIVRLAVGKDRIQRRAFAAMQNMAAAHRLTATRRIEAQVAAVLDLAPADGSTRTGTAGRTEEHPVQIVS